MDSLEVLNSVDQFYNSAWEKLIIFTAILIGIVGFLMPLLITWWQNRSLKIREESLRKEFERLLTEKLTPLKAELTKTIDDKLKEKFKEMEEKIDNKIEATEAISYHIQGNNNIKEQQFKGAILNFISSGGGYLKGEDFNNLNRINSQIVTYLPKLTKEDFEELEMDKFSPIEYYKLLEEKNKNGIFTDVIRNIKREVKKIEKKGTTTSK